MNLLNPAYWWALAALAVPLAIHLLSRKEGKVIRIGSLRHIRETPTRQFRSLRLNEYLLLILRMVLLALLTLFLAGWYLPSLKDHDKWLVVEPVLERRSELVPLFDSLESSGYQSVWLAPGFPLRTEQSLTIAPDYGARLEELQKMPIEEAVIVSTNRLAGYHGPKAQLPSNVKWIDVPPAEGEVAVSRIQWSPDSVLVCSGKFEMNRTAFVSNISLGKHGRTRDTVRIVLASSSEFEADKNALHAVLTVLRRQAVDVLKVNEVPAERAGDLNPDFLFWLSNEPVPATMAAVFYVDELASGRLVEQISANRYCITGRLNSEVVISRNLAVHLMSILSADSRAQAVADSADARVFPMRAALSAAGKVTNTSLVEKGNDTSTRYLLAAILCIFLLERFVANRRNQ